MRKDLDLWRSRRTDMNPFREMFDISSRLNRVFDNFFNTATETGASFGIDGAMESEETATHYLLRIEMPGVPRDHIRVETLGNQVHIRVEEESDTGGNHSRRYHRFERSLTLPAEFDADSIEANYLDGVLELAIPKAQTEKPRAVSIGQGQGIFSRYLHKAKQAVKEVVEAGSAERQPGKRSRESAA